jgi:hypothetical protein
VLTSITCGSAGEECNAVNKQEHKLLPSEIKTSVYKKFPADIVEREGVNWKRNFKMR